MMFNRRFIRLIVLTLCLTVFAGTVTEAVAQTKKERERAQRLIRQGDQAFNQRDYREAVAKYAEAIILVPNFAPVRFWKGYAHYYLKEYDQAIAEFDQALAKGFNKPLDVLRLRWFIYLEQKNYDAALADALEIVRLEPNNGANYFSVATVHQVRKQWAEALDFYKQGLKYKTDDGDVYYFIAECHANLGDFLNQGFAALDALKYKTKYVGESYYLIADAFYRARKYDEAIEYYERTINVKPEIYGSYNGLADIFRIKNRFNDAIRVTRDGLARFPNDANLYVGLSWYYSLANRHQEAIDAAKSAINLDARLPMGHTNLCRAYNDTAQYNLAIQSCNNALRLAPGDGESHLYLARAYEFLKQTERATENYNKAIAGLQKFTGENPEYSDGFFLLGNAYFAMERDREAVAAYTRCLELAPNFARARFSLGVTYNTMGRKDLAREQLEALRNLDPALAERLRVVIDGR